ncbi:transposase, partial [Propionibacterium acidifaciens]|uniref:transposase n=1 Tax=Propionibacterium acidifaciens TaxID=556499 RepID=UPI0028E73C36
LLQQETGTGKTAVVPDNARPHHARALTDLHEPDRLLERITPVFLPPYAPDHNPAEHVRNTAKNNTTTIQHETPEETLGASAPHITGRTFDHDFEHLPTPRNQKRFCFMTAIILPHDHFAHCPKNTKHSTVLLQGRTSPRAPTCPAGAPPSSRHRRPGHRPTRLATTGARRTSSHRTGV